MRAVPSHVSDAISRETGAYLTELVARLRAILGAELVGVYAGGSLALGGYDPPRSDLDIAAVSRDTLPDETKRDVTAGLRHESLPCPARGLELVVYAEHTVRTGTREAAYELNLNTGGSMPFHVSFAPGDGEAEHWYAIDRAVIRDHGRALLGPPPAQLFAALPQWMLVDLLVDSVRWHERSGMAHDDDAVLNACRALRYAAEGAWSSKPDAAEWARGRVADGDLVSAAVAARAGPGAPLDRRRVVDFLEAARRRLEAGAAGRHA